MADAHSGSALGLLETYGLVAAIEAADAMLKASAVRLVRQQRTVPAMVTHFVVGDTSAVQAAVDAGAAAASRVGRVVAAHVIPSPSDDVWRVLVGSEPSKTPTPKTTRKKKPSKAAATPGKAAPPSPAPPADDYGGRTVRQLRSLARDRDDDRLRGRAIASASKDELVAFLRASDGSPSG